MLLLRAIRAANPGDVLVIDSRGYMSRSVAGDFVVGLAQILGLGEIVVDGSIRDVISIKSSGFPVFCRDVTSSASAKSGGGAINIPISCGGVFLSIPAILLSVMQMEMLLYPKIRNKSY